IDVLDRIKGIPDVPRHTSIRDVVDLGPNCFRGDITQILHAMLFSTVAGSLDGVQNVPRGRHSACRPRVCPSRITSVPASTARPVTTRIWITVASWLATSGAVAGLAITLSATLLITRL